MLRTAIICLLFCSSATFAFDRDSSNQLVLRDSIVNYASKFLGTPYKWGGHSEGGFDCTGFVHFVFKKFGIIVSRASSGYEGKGEEVPIEESVPGDIILFTGTDHTKRRVGHAGIIYRNLEGEIDFIHSSSSKKHFGVVITRYNESGYLKRFLRVINVLSK